MLDQWLKISMGFCLGHSADLVFLYSFLSLYLNIVIPRFFIYFYFCIFILNFHTLNKQRLAVSSAVRVVPIHRKKGISNFDQLLDLAQEYNLGHKACSRLAERGGLLGYDWFGLVKNEKMAPGVFLLNFRHNLVDIEEEPFLYSSHMLLRTSDRIT